MKKILSLVLFLGFYAIADELKLSYLEITETKVQNYSVLLKIPSKDNKKLDITISMPKNCQITQPKVKRLHNNSFVESWGISCEQGLRNQILQVEGLKATDTELLLRLELLSSSHSMLLTPHSPSYSIPNEQSSWEILQTYTWLGVTHILIGFDHLLFVFALLLIVKNMRRLLWTITAFTLAHSLTMAVATLGFVSVPQAPIEAIIALSILFLAMEIVHEKQGKIGLTSSYPWLIAFIFGLLHGFGFAGALSEIGIPQHAITLALLFFNIGVELGQLIFVATVILIILGLQRLNYPSLINRLQTLVVYIIGGVSAFWLIERTLSF